MIGQRGVMKRSKHSWHNGTRIEITGSWMENGTRIGWRAAAVNPEQGNAIPFLIGDENIGTTRPAPAVRYGVFISSDPSQGPEAVFDTYTAALAWLHGPFFHDRLRFMRSCRKRSTTVILGGLTETGVPWESTVSIKRWSPA